MSFKDLSKKTEAPKASGTAPKPDAEKTEEGKKPDAAPEKKS